MGLHVQAQHSYSRVKNCRSFYSEEKTDSTILVTTIRHFHFFSYSRSVIHEYRYSGDSTYLVSDQKFVDVGQCFGHRYTRYFKSYWPNGKKDYVKRNRKEKYYDEKGRLTKVVKPERSIRRVKAAF